MVIASRMIPDGTAETEETTHEPASPGYRAAGYIGSVLCEHLLDSGYQVTGVDTLFYGQPSLFHLCASPRFEFVRGDARDEGLMRRLVKEADVLIPLAAIVGAPGCDRDPWLARTVNLDAVQLAQPLA